jgi:hypothetical protein
MLSLSWEREQARGEGGERERKRDMLACMQLADKGAATQQCNAWREGEQTILLLLLSFVDSWYQNWRMRLFGVYPVGDGTWHWLATLVPDTTYD